MFYVPVTESYYRLSPTYIPVSNTRTDDSNAKLTEVQKELAVLREELKDLRSEKESCRICSASRQAYESDDTCSICYERLRSRPREENYSRRPLSPSPSSSVHYCSICQDYVIDQLYPPPLSSSPSHAHRKKPKKHVEYNDGLPEYLSRQIDLQRLHPRYVPNERSVWIPTAYKHDYPHRRWATRQSHFSEP